jgi:hypothetical protein
MKRTRLLIGLPVTLVALALLGWFLLHHASRQQPPTSTVPATGLDRTGPEAVAERSDQDSREAKPSLPGAGPLLIEEIRGPRAYFRLQELAASGSLTGEQCRALVDFVAQQTPDEGLARTAAIKNMVLNLLARQEALPERWDRLLQRIIEDEDQNTVIRAYALQHLFTWYEDMLQAGHTDVIGGEELKAVADLFWRLTDHEEGSIASTALLGLCHLAACDPALDVTRVGRKAGVLLHAPGVDPLMEISAFQVAGLLKQRDVLERALDVARTGTGIASRVSAIGAVGALGGEGEAAAIEVLLEDPNPSIRTAARTALARLNSKDGG